MKIRITKVPKNIHQQQENIPQEESNMMAIGGDIQTHGGDFSTGLRKIGAGRTHEENPYEGVQVGVDPEGKPNLVEENETIFNDYVYSNRIYADGGALERFHLPKNKEITYAEISKRLEKEASERPNDPLSQAALKIQMANLAEEQERQKQEMQAEEAKEAFAQLSPEEQVAVMQQIQVQQQGPSPEEQAMMEQQAMQEQGMGQPQMSPEEAAMMEQQMAMQGGGQPMGIEQAMAQQAMAQQQGMPQEAMVPQQPMMACGGKLRKVNKFGDGGFEKWWKNTFDKYAFPAYRSAINYFYPGRYSIDQIEHQPEITESEIASIKSQLKAIYEEQKDKFDSFDYDTALASSRAGTSSASSTATTSTPAATATTTTATTPAATTSTPAASITLTGKDLGKEVMNSIGVKTWPALIRWAEKNNVDKKLFEGKSYNSMSNEDWSRVLQNDSFSKAFAKSNSALAHALGLYNSKDESVAPINIEDIPVITPNTTASWGNHEFNKWWGDYDTYDEASKHWDPMYKEVVDALIAEEKAKGDQGKTVDRNYNLDPKDFRERLQGTQSWRDTTEWLRKDPNNVLAYFNAILDPNNNSPEKAIEFAKKYVDPATGKWRDDVPEDQRNYESTIKQKREDNYPASYWYSSQRALHGGEGKDIIENYLQNENGDWELMALDVPEGWTPQSTYNWSINSGNRTANYYVDPAVKAAVKEAAAEEEANKRIAPILKSEAARYAGLLGPVVGLGMMAAGIGKPQLAAFDGVLDAYRRNGANLATMDPTGNYLKYQPFDYATTANAQAAANAAAQRAILASGATAGGAQAGILSGARNLIEALGDTYTKGQMNNFDQRAKVTAHNAEIDKHNADAFNRLSQFNAGVLNDAAKTAANLGLQTAAQKAEMKAKWDAAKYANVNELFKGISDLGWQNTQENWLRRLLATGALGNGDNENPLFAGMTDYYDNLTDEQKRRLEGKGGLFHGIV